VPLVPRDVKKAIALLEADPGRKNSVDELAAECGVARRTLEKHFRRFVGRSPSQVKRDLLLERVRRELLRASPEVTTTEIAVRCGIGHLGRFAAAYRGRWRKPFRDPRGPPVGPHAPPVHVTDFVARSQSPNHQRIPLRYYRNASAGGANNCERDRCHPYAQPLARSRRTWQCALPVARNGKRRRR
jgi:AraC-like DNA-binding protein